MDSEEDLGSWKAFHFRAFFSLYLVFGFVGWSRVFFFQILQLGALARILNIN